MRRPHPRWLVALAGVAAGLVLGLAYAWLVDPVRPVETHPDMLRSDYRDEWVRLVALSFLSDGDLGRMRARLRGIDDADASPVIEDVVQAYSRPGQYAVGLRLRALADAVQMQLPALGSAADPDGLPGQPQTAGSRSNSAAVSYRVAQMSLACKPGSVPQVEVVVRETNGRGIAGARIWLLSDQGADWATTGLMPANGAGYADFAAEEEVRYSLGIGEIGLPLANNLRIKGCEDGVDGTERSGVWRILIERQPTGDGQDRPVG